MLSCYSAVCATPMFCCCCRCLFVYFFASRLNTRSEFLCYLGHCQFLEAQHASFLSSKESGILITLVKISLAINSIKTENWSNCKHLTEAEDLLQNITASFLRQLSSWEIYKHSMLPNCSFDICSGWNFFPDSRNCFLRSFDLSCEVCTLKNMQAKEAKAMQYLLATLLDPLCSLYECLRPENRSAYWAQSFSATQARCMICSLVYMKLEEGFCLFYLGMVTLWTK